MAYKPLIASLTLVLSVCAAACVRDHGFSAAPAPAPLPARRPTPIRVLVLDQSFTVRPRAFKSWHFDAPPGGARVTGRFEAQGGSGNDIECIIVNEDGYVNLTNGHSVGSYYNSGKATVGTIKLNLGPGRYYIVFRNQAIFMNKAVTATLNLESS